MQISDGTRPLLSAPNPRAWSGNDMGLDEMNDERDKTGAVTWQKEGVHTRIKTNLDPCAKVQTDGIFAIFLSFGPSAVLL